MKNKIIDILIPILTSILIFTISFIISNNFQKIEVLKYKVKELELKVKILEQDHIVFENMHADHYGFEENKVLELIEPNKANNYKVFLDSIKNKSNN